MGSFCDAEVGTGFRPGVLTALTASFGPTGLALHRVLERARAWGTLGSMPHADEALLAVAQNCLPQADSDTHAIVAAVAGLLGCVAYADRELSAVERQRAQNQLATVQGLDDAGAAMLVGGIANHLHELSNVHRNRFTRTLRDLGSRELRVHVLGMLVELAATDEELVQSEVNWLRQTATALGLTQADYNELQKQYRQHLGTLKQ